MTTLLDAVTSSPGAAIAVGGGASAVTLAVVGLARLVGPGIVRAWGRWTSARARVAETQAADDVAAAAWMREQITELRDEVRLVRADRDRDRADHERQRVEDREECERQRRADREACDREIRAVRGDLGRVATRALEQRAEGLHGRDDTGVHELAEIAQRMRTPVPPERRELPPPPVRRPKINDDSWE